jgi:hypothetical protein
LVGCSGESTSRVKSIGSLGAIIEILLISWFYLSEGYEIREGIEKKRKTELFVE